MDWSPIKLSQLGIAVLIACMSALLPALAAPPTAQRLPPTSTSQEREGHRETLIQHLDLRAPATADSALVGYGVPAAQGRFLHSPNRAEIGGNDDLNESRSAESAHAPIQGNIEAFAQRFRREGLPIARLWENHAAMVSLGLNGKGKPGLWVVQKTR